METQDLIDLVSCAVNGVQPDPDRIAEMDLDALYNLASRHMLAATVAPALETAGVKDARFIRALNHSALKNAQMDVAMKAIFTKLDAAEIWHMPLKGIVLQHLYPVYGMRQMADHDILFDAERADDVKAIMEGLGFSTERFGVYNHDVYHKEPVCNFEMHRALFGPAHDQKLYEYYGDMKSRLLGDGTEKHFSPEDFYLYMTAHEYKHYSRSGTGLRSLLDTYVYLKAETLDMDYITAEAEKLGLTEFEAANRALALRLFSGETLTEADREMLEYFLSSGVYGTAVRRIENKMRKNGWGKLRYALNYFIAPESRYYYPFFNQHRILLPLLPFYRTFRAMKKGRFLPHARAILKAQRPTDQTSLTPPSEK